MVMLCFFDINGEFMFSSCVKNGFSKDGVIFMCDIKYLVCELLNIVLNFRENEVLFVVLCDLKKVLIKLVV